MDSLPPGFLNGAGVVAIVVLLGLLLARGILVTRREADAVCHDRDEWRTEARIKDQQIHELTEQNTAMLHEFGPTVTDLLRGIRRQADARSEEDET